MLFCYSLGLFGNGSNVAAHDMEMNSPLGGRRLLVNLKIIFIFSRNVFLQNSENLIERAQKNRALVIITNFGNRRDCQVLPANPKIVSFVILHKSERETRRPPFLGCVVFRSLCCCYPATDCQMCAAVLASGLWPLFNTQFIAHYLRFCVGWVLVMVKQNAPKIASQSVTQNNAQSAAAKQRATTHQNAQKSPIPKRAGN